MSRKLHRSLLAGLLLTGASQALAQDPIDPWMNLLDSLTWPPSPVNYYYGTGNSLMTQGLSPQYNGPYGEGYLAGQQAWSQYGQYGMSVISPTYGPYGNTWSGPVWNSGYQAGWSSNQQWSKEVGEDTPPPLDNLPPSASELIEEDAGFDLEAALTEE